MYIPAAVNSELMRMAMKGDVAQVLELLGAGANPDQQNKYGFSALMFAAWQGARRAIPFPISAAATVCFHIIRNLETMHD